VETPGVLGHCLPGAIFSLLAGAQPQLTDSDIVICLWTKRHFSGLGKRRICGDAAAVKGARAPGGLALDGTRQDRSYT